MQPILGFVVPCYNEQEVLDDTITQLSELLASLCLKNMISLESKILLVDDGSKDSTWSIIESYALVKKHVCGIKLSGNVGHQNALIAGLEYSLDKCDLAISLDCDLQDDIDLVDSMIDKFKNGYEVIYGVRDDRSSDTFFKRFSAESFYDIMKVLGVNIIRNHADYRALSNRAIRSLLSFREANLFLRGIVPLLGYQSCKLYYKRNARVAGESKYPFLKMLSFALDGITSFSVQPLRILSIIGATISLASLIFGLWALITYFMGRTISGWTSVVVPMYFLGGLQLLGLGILGEYIGKIYKETKNRPRYFIDSIID